MKERQEPIRLTAKRKEIPVEIEELDGSTNVYTVRELSGHQHTEFTNSMLGNTVFNGKGEFVKFKTMKGVTAALLTRAVYTSENVAVTADWVEQMPFTVVQQLYDLAQEISGLSLEADEDAKND